MPKRRRNPYFRKILVGYDGSPQADKAVEVAFSLAQLTDCKGLGFGRCLSAEASDDGGSSCGARRRAEVF
jgi:nucleotide-binding universal stress UspA family protein